jgi:hypothetical protein
VVNVADPRNPVRVGRLELTSEGASGLAIWDTTAYVSYYPLSIISIADPAQPRLLGSIARGAWGVDVRDSVLVLASGGLVWYNVAEPSNPRAIDSISFAANTFAVKFSDTIVYASSRDKLRAVSLANLHEPRMVGQCELPYEGLRLALDTPYVVVACGMAGLAIVESALTGVGERSTPPEQLAGRLRVQPNPTRGQCAAGLGSGFRGRVTVRDALGRLVCTTVVDGVVAGGVPLDLRGLPKGIYFVEVRETCQSARIAVVKY